MVQLVGSVCAVLLALSLALAATLLREGHFAACIENSGYLDTLHTAVLDTCGGYAAAAGTTADPLADIITPEAVRAGVLHRADGLWHGSTVDETDPFNDLIVTYQDNVAPEPAAYDGYRILQYNCQMEWKSAMATPFSAAISMVLQYRTVVAVTMYLSALLLVGCIALQYRLAARWRVFCRGLLHMADACLLAGAVLAGWLGFGSGYRSWTAVGDIGYTLFCRWFGALPRLCWAAPRWWRPSRPGWFSGSACNITARKRSAPLAKPKNLCYNISIRQRRRLIALLSDGAFSF